MKIVVADVPPNVGSLYPEPYDAPCLTRERRRLGDVAGLTQFGVNLLTLPPGVWSSQRHWHTESDELVYVLEGEVTLAGEHGSEILRAGDAAAFKAGDTNAHCLKNHTQARAVVLEVGSRVPSDAVHYPGIDLYCPPEGKPALFTHRDGTPYPNRRRGPT